MSEPELLTYRSGFAELVSEALGDKAELSDHFLDVGGDSLIAAIVVNMVVARDGFVPEITWFFELETIQEIADRCHSALRESKVSQPS